MSKHKQKDNFRDLTIEERNKIKNRTEEEARISWNKLSEDQKSTFKTSWFAGFWEGEGSITSSVKKIKTLRFGYQFLNEVSICQHVSGIHHLWWAKHNLFHDIGNITYKLGSDATFTYQFSNTKALNKYFVPWYKEHVLPFVSVTQVDHWNKWVQLVELKKTTANWDLTDVQKVAMIVYDLNSKKGRQRKVPLDDLLGELSAWQPTLKK
jgi:hypothetical protein